MQQISQKVCVEPERWMTAWQMQEEKYEPEEEDATAVIQQITKTPLQVNLQGSPEEFLY